MLIWLISSLISTASAKAPALAAKAIAPAPARAAPAAVENFRRPYYSFLRVQSQIIGQLGQKTLNTKSPASLKQKFQVIRKDYRNLRADVVAPHFDVQKVGAGIKQYKQDFHSYVNAVPTSSERHIAAGLELASTQSTRYLVSAVDRSAPLAAGKKLSDAPVLAQTIGAQGLGLPPQTSMKDFNFASFVPAMTMRNGLPVAQAIDLKSNTVQAEVRATGSASSEAAANDLPLDEATSSALAATSAESQSSVKAAEAQSEGGTEVRGEEDKLKAEQAGPDKASGETDKVARKIDPTSRRDLECLERGNIDARGSCSAGGSLDKIGYKDVKGGPSCSSSGGGTLCDPAFYPGSGGNGVCVSSTKTCKQGSREIVGNPPPDYVQFLTQNKAVVEAKIARIRETCEGQSNASCQEMLNRANSIEVWMGWNGDRYQNVAAAAPAKKPISAGVWNSGWLNGGGTQDAVNASTISAGSRQ